MLVTMLGSSVVLVLGDALATPLSALPPFDAVLTDPPYGIKHVKGPTGRAGAYARGKRSRRNASVIIGDDVPFDPVWVLGLSDNVAMFGADHYATRLPSTGRWLAWDKLAGRDPWDSFSDVEFIWHSRRGKSEVLPWLWKGIACRKEGEQFNARRFHPTQKPVRVMEWLLRSIGARERVLDPYMGSGTTGVACVRSGIDFIGIELDPTHYAAAVLRISHELDEAPLLIEV